jgi:hypothetical protein
MTGGFTAKAPGYGQLPRLPLWKGASPWKIIEKKFGNITPGYLLCNSKYFQMNSSTQNLEALHDIKRIMERSGRFISLSGLSGIAVGVCALLGAGAANYRINLDLNEFTSGASCASCLRRDLLLIAGIVWVAAVTVATLFTYLKTQKEGVAMWGSSAKRLLWNTLLPMVAGGFLIWRMIGLEQYALIASASLIFYGIALVNGSKYTLGEVRYLGYAEIVTGIAGLWLPGSGLLYWTIGFGVLHIIYGVAMWWKYDRVPGQPHTDLSDKKPLES